MFRLPGCVRQARWSPGYHGIRADCLGDCDCVLRDDGRHWVNALRNNTYGLQSQVGQWNTKLSRRPIWPFWPPVRSPSSPTCAGAAFPIALRGLGAGGLVFAVVQGLWAVAGASGSCWR